MDAGKSTPVFFLSEAYLSGQTCEIDENQYRTLEQALDTLVCALEIENVFQVFEHAFRRFEEDLLSLAFEYRYRSAEDFFNDIFFSSVRHRLSTDVITLLTSYKKAMMITAPEPLARFPEIQA